MARSDTGLTGLGETLCPSPCPQSARRTCAKGQVLVFTSLLFLRNQITTATINIAMHAHLFTFALGLLLLMVCLAPNIALATHTTCSWRPGNGVPKDNKFYMFCPAGLDSDGVYDCRSSIFLNKKGLQVASYGRTAHDVFEWRESRGQAQRYCFGVRADAYLPAIARSQSVPVVRAEATG